MTTLFMLKGLPASGKTTHAKQMTQLGIKRVNRDELRLMVDSGVYSKENEHLIRKLAENMLIEILVSGHDAVIDNTNLKPSDEEGWRKFAHRWARYFKVIEMKTPLEECIRRDAKRENPVGEEAIRSMARLEPNPLLSKPKGW